MTSLGKDENHNSTKIGEDGEFHGGRSCWATKKQAARNARRIRRRRREDERNGDREWRTISKRAEIPLMEGRRDIPKVAKGGRGIFQKASRGQGNPNGGQEKSRTAEREEFENGR